MFYITIFINIVSYITTFLNNTNFFQKKCYSKISKFVFRIFLYQKISNFFLFGRGRKLLGKLDGKVWERKISNLKKNEIKKRKQIISFVFFFSFVKI